MIADYIKQFSERLRSTKYEIKIIGINDKTVTIHTGKYTSIVSGISSYQDFEQRVEKEINNLKFLNMLFP